MGQLSADVYQHLEHTGLGCPLQGAHAVCEVEPIVDQRADVDVAGGERLERPIEGTAPRTDNRDLVDHYRGESERLGTGDGRLENDGAARADESQRRRQTARRSRAVDNDVGTLLGVAPLCAFG